MLKIISSNIRFDSPHDGVHSWIYRRDILASSINNFSADILATQEGRRPQILDLASRLNNLCLVESHRPWLEERMYPCIYINPQTILLNGSGDIWLSEQPYDPGSLSFQSSFPRLCTWISGIYLPLKIELIFVNTHLDHVLTTTRQSQINVLVNEINKIKVANQKLFLAGDFNEGPEGKVRSLIESAWPTLQDPWKVLKKEESATHFSFSGQQKNCLRIDWILVDKSLVPVEAIIDRTQQNGIYPSDHYPIKASFLLPTS